jgi:hypothetical protein
MYAAVAVISRGKKKLSEKIQIEKTAREELGHIGRKSNGIHYER